MESVIRLITSIQGLLQVLALAAAAYALYELISEPDWRRRPAQTLARVWVVFLCGAAGLAGLLLGQNAVLLFADRTGSPLGTTQIAFAASLILAVVVWSRD